jgi:hypothetical protein
MDVTTEVADIEMRVGGIHIKQPRGIGDIVLAQDKQDVGRRRGRNRCSDLDC